MDNCECFDKKRYEGNIVKEITGKLKRIKVDSYNWKVLYICEKCNTYWEKSYQNSALHGGGNPILYKVSKEYVKNNWND